MNKNPLLRLIKTDDRGNKWYGYKEPGELPFLRSQIADIAKTFNSFKITKESLTELLEIQKKATTIEEKNKIADEIILRSNYIADEDCLLKLCSVYFCLNDENPEIFDSNYDEQKIALLKEDYKLKCFFLYLLQSMTPVWPDMFPLDMVEYLEGSKELKDEIVRQTMHLNALTR